MIRILNIISLTLVMGLCVTLTLSQSYNQKAVLYINPGCIGAGITLQETYSPDLSLVNVDNKASSVLVTGNWLFYDLKNYNPKDGLMEFAFGPSNFCLNLEGTLGIVSSARFAGSPKDYRSNSITLYTGTYFQGEEEYTYVDLGNLNLDRQSSSLIITGNNSWTLYDEPDFKGHAICVNPPLSENYTPAFVVDTNSLNIPHQTIRSVRLGCFAQQKLVVDNVLHGGVNGIKTNSRPLSRRPIFSTNSHPKH